VGENDTRHILDKLGDAVFAADAREHVTYVNPAAARLLGFAAAELIGRPLDALLPGLSRGRDPARTLTSRVRTTRKTGEAIDVEVRLTVTAQPGGASEDANGPPHIVGSLRDVSARDGDESPRKVAMHRHLQAATELATRLSSRLDLDHVLKTTVSALIDDFDATLGRIWLTHVAPAPSSLRVRASAGTRAESAIPPREGEGAALPVEVRAVAETLQPFVRDAGDPGQGAAWVGSEGIGSVAALPLVAAGELRGVMAVYFREPPSPDAVLVLATVAAMLSASLNDVRLFEREHAARVHLTTQLEVATALAEAGTLDEAMPRVLQSMAVNLGWDEAVLWRVDRRDEVLRVCAAFEPFRPSLPPPPPRASADEPITAPPGRTLARGEGLAGAVWATGEAHGVGPDGPRGAPRPLAAATGAGQAGQTGHPGQGAGDIGVHSALGFPIRVRGETAFVLELCSRSPRPAYDRLLETMRGLADQIRQFMERAFAEAALRDAEQRLITTLRSIGDAVIATDVEGLVTFMNPMAESLTGWKMADARGRKLEDVFLILSEHSRSVMENPVSKVLREGRVIGMANHTALVSRTGTVRSIEDSGAPIRDDEGVLLGVVLVFRDVTAARRATNRRRFLAQAASTLASSLDYGVTLTNVAHLAVPRLADWCVVHVIEAGGTPQPLAIAHVNPSKVEWARELQERYPEDATAVRGLANVIRTGKSELYRTVDEARLVAGARDPEHLRVLRELSMKSAMIVPMVANGRPLGAITFVVAESDHRYDDADVTMAEELAARAALAIDNARLHSSLQEGEERIRLVLESAGEAIVGIDLLGRCIFANPACARLLGYPGPEALIGKDIRDLTHRGGDGDKGLRSRRIDEMCMEGDEGGERVSEGVHVPEELLGRADGTSFWAECWSYPIVRDARRVGAVLTFVDITERKRGEEEHARLLVELEDAVRLRDDFLSIASHELRTPLTPLLLHVQAIQRSIRRGKLDELSPAILTDKLGSIARQIQRMERLVDSLLDIARITGKRLFLHPEELDLTALVDEVVARHKEELDRAGCKVNVTTPGPLPGAWDRLRLDQVVSNLLSNALKFGPGKPIEVRLEADREECSMRIVVSDAGIGISPADQRRIFERFERAVPTRHYGGFGLGLWIVRQIVEAMGGIIRVHSTLGEGATFIVDLPIVTARTAPLPRADERAQPAS
jgi:PAS domain S-box-containing protein